MKIQQQISKVKMSNDCIITVEGWLPVGSLLNTQWGSFPVIENTWEMLDDSLDAPENC
tara:strand:+ start:518 stop:691 length:174 start_codon:yes stop_codon:yes gene_type:complete